ncbi:MAG: hypothetical protein R3B38_01700 [Patescibacteria group bacterium]
MYRFQNQNHFHTTSSNQVLIWVLVMTNVGLIITIWFSPMINSWMNHQPAQVHIQEQPTQTQVQAQPQPQVQSNQITQPQYYQPVYYPTPQYYYPTTPTYQPTVPQQPLPYTSPLTTDPNAPVRFLMGS